MFDTKLGSRSRSGHKRSPYIKHKYQRCGTCFVGYFTRRLFYTFYMVMVFLQFECIWVSLATRSGQGHVKNSKFLKCLISKNKDLFLPQNNPRIPMVPFVFLYVV